MSLKSLIILKGLVMGDGDKKDLKLEKKRIKAEAKASKVGMSFLSGSYKMKNIPDGIEVNINKTQNGSQLVVTGLNDDQLNRLIPQINKEVLISITEDQSSLKAALMRFVREGIFQTIIKVIAGLVVGYVLIKVRLS